MIRHALVAVIELPPAQLAWLSFSEEETDDARALIAALQRPGVIDELGFAPLVSAFAERFYPATTTIMTRCRYLFFVPAIYGYIERLPKLNGAKDLARKLQGGLRETLKENEGVDVIGVESEDEVKRLPSNVYWASLGALGIFKCDTSERAYLEHLDARVRQRKGVKDNNDQLMREDEEPSWDPAFVVPEVDAEGRFRPKEAFALSVREARQLQRRFSDLDEQRLTGPSLLSHLVEVRDTWWPADLDWPWSIERLPAELRRATLHARALSNLARGVLLQYHHMLLLAQAAAGFAASDKVDFTTLFEQWWDERADYGLTTWNLDELATLPLLADVRSRRDDVAFFRQWLGAILRCKTAAAALDDTTAHQLVRDRERAKRPTKARLQPRSQFLETWGPRLARSYDGPFELGYRHGIGFSFVRDIVHALSGGKA